MHSETSLSPEVWERIPPEAQAYIRALEPRVGALEETVERSAAGLGPTAPPRAQRAAARRAARSRGADAGASAGRGGRCRHPGQAGVLSTLPAPIAGSGLPAPAASSDGDPTCEAGGHRVSVASLGVPILWRVHPGRTARGRSAW